MKAYALRGCVAALLSLQGCTSLNAVRVTDGVMKAEGAPYFLTFTQYDITVKRRLTSCFDDSKDTPPKKVPNMTVTTTVEAKRKEARDPAREYVIDFAALRSFFKTTDVAVEYYETGSLKSVNATVTDKTAEFLTSTFTAVAKAVALGTGVGGAVAPDACKPEIAKAVVAAKEAEGRLAAKTAEIARQTEQLEKLQTVAVALGPTRNATERREFADQVKAVFALKAEVDREQKELSKLINVLTVTTSVTWPKDGWTFSGRIVEPLPVDIIDRWGSLGEGLQEKLQAGTGVWAVIGTDSPSAHHVVCKGDSCERKQPVKELPGLKYRMAMPGTLRACSNATCTGKEVELYKDVGLFSQLGPVMTLPLRNLPFMAQTIVLTMNEAGQPTKIGYKSEAGAAKAMDAVNTFVDEYGKVRESKKPKSELDLVKEETALLEARTKLIAAKAALDPKPNVEQSTATEALKADTALLEAELAKLKAQAALDEARKIAP